MKTRFICLMAVVLLFATFCSSCKKDEKISVHDVTLNIDNMILIPGAVYNLTATIIPDNATDPNIRWESSNPDVATVSDGVVTAVSEGETEIKVTTISGNKTATCNIAVRTKIMKMTTEANSVTIGLTGSGEIAIDWGDGTIIELYSLTSKIVYIAHVFKSNFNKIITIGGGNITRLLCEGNQLTELDVSNFSELVNLQCLYNKLTNLDVSNNSLLDTLWCNSNELTSLDVSNKTALTALSCNDNQLTNLNVKGCSELNYFRCNNNNLTSLDVSECLFIFNLYCQYNKIMVLNVDENIRLERLNCSNNRIMTLNLTNNNRLSSLLCSINPISELELSNNDRLTTLDFERCRIKNIDLSMNTVLQEINCNYNQLTQLDMGNNTALKTLLCQANKLSGEEIDNLFDSLHNNEITGKSIDVSYNPGTNDCSQTIATSKEWTVIAK